MATTKTPDVAEQFSWEEEFERVKWFKDDLQRKEGWKTVLSVPGAKYHIKSFPDDRFPVKILSEWELPCPAKVAINAIMDMELRIKWDTSYQIELLGKSDDGGTISSFFTKMPWPLWDRLFLIKLRMKEFTEQNAWLISVQDTKHPSKPERSDVVRAINGGNFNYFTPDEGNPQEASKMFALSTNDFGGWLPKSSTWLWGRTVPPNFDRTRSGLLKAIAEKRFEKYR